MENKTNQENIEKLKKILRKLGYSAEEITEILSSEPEEVDWI